MSSRRLAKVPLFGSPLKAATVDLDATEGAVVGINLFWPDGSLVTRAQLSGGTGASSGSDLTTTDDLDEGAYHLYFTDRRAQDAVGGILTDTATIDLAYAGGASITATLKDLADSGEGAALVKITRDSKGRISGTSAATTSDLPEGSNLYYTDERADARVDAGITALKAEADPFPQYTTDDEAAAAAPVQSVNGATGDVALTAADVGAATAAQGALADTALQPGANVSTLANDAGYVDAAGAAAAAPIQSLVEGANITIDTTDPQNPVISATGGGGGAVDSVNGQTGTVVLDASDVGAEPAITAGTSDQYLDGAKSWQNFATSVRAAVLTGLSTATSAVIAATDTVLQALGKLQAQITDNLLPKGYIDGLDLNWVSGTSISARSGAAYIEGLGRVLRVDATITVAGLSLSASTLYHVYLYNNAGTPAIEVVTTAPDAPYIGSARSKAGDTSRRYLGDVVTDSSGAIYNFINRYGRVIYRVATSASPFRVLSSGTSTSEVNVSCAAVIPSTARIAIVRIVNNTPSVATFGTSDDSVPLSAAAFMLRVPNGEAYPDIALDSSQRFSYLVNDGSSGGLFVDIRGYQFER